MGISTNYHEWRHCIEVKCGITLSANIIQQRIKALSDLNNPASKEFAKLYRRNYRMKGKTLFLNIKK